VRFINVQQKITRRALAGAVLALAAALALAGPKAGSAAAPSPAASQAPQNAKLERVVLAGGCFWGMEAVFGALKGVHSAMPGYSGGSKDTAHYEVVSTGTTGHAESVEVAYDPAVISFRQLLEVYFLVAHDPTQLNRQGPDSGTQYRSAIFYTTDAQRRAAEAEIAKLNAAKTFAAPIVTQVVAFRAFYPAEDYHRHYVALHPDQPYVAINDLPKLQQLKERYPNLVAAQ
jgi:peptide-methionine (S)-S-oxide reductase